MHRAEDLGERLGYVLNELEEAEVAGQPAGVRIVGDERALSHDRREQVRDVDLRKGVGLLAE